MSTAPFVRQYNSETDLDDVVHIFRETADPSLQVEPVHTIGSFMWCRPYLVLSPATCFVLEDGRGKAVGYILGTPDTSEFSSRWKTHYLPTVKPELDNLPPIEVDTIEARQQVSSRRDDLLTLIRNDPHKLIFGNLASTLEPWPGHFHIDILPSHQRQGNGKKLIHAFLEAAKAEGCSGVYLGMVASNNGAARFYGASGFRRLPHVLDDRASGEMGRTSRRADGGETIYFVIDL